MSESDSAPDFIASSSGTHRKGGNGDMTSENQNENPIRAAERQRQEERGRVIADIMTGRDEIGSLLRHAVRNTRPATNTDAIGKLIYDIDSKKQAVETNLVQGVGDDLETEQLRQALLSSENATGLDVRAPIVTWQSDLMGKNTVEVVGQDLVKAADMAMNKLTLGALEPYIESRIAFNLKHEELRSLNTELARKGEVDDPKALAVSRKETRQNEIRMLRAGLGIIDRYGDQYDMQTLKEYVNQKRSDVLSANEKDDLKPDKKATNSRAEREAKRSLKEIDLDESDLQRSIDRAVIIREVEIAKRIRQAEMVSIKEAAAGFGKMVIRKLTSEPWRIDTQAVREVAGELRQGWKTGTETINISGAEKGKVSTYAERFVRGVDKLTGGRVKKLVEAKNLRGKIDQAVEAVDNVEAYTKAIMMPIVTAISKAESTAGEKISHDARRLNKYAEVASRAPQEKFDQKVKEIKADLANPDFSFITRRIEDHAEIISLGSRAELIQRMEAAGEVVSVAQTVEASQREGYFILSQTLNVTNSSFHRITTNELKASLTKEKDRTDVLAYSSLQVSDPEIARLHLIYAGINQQLIDVAEGFLDTKQSDDNAKYVKRIEELLAKKQIAYDKLQPHLDESDLQLPEATKDEAKLHKAYTTSFEAARKNCSERLRAESDAGNNSQLIDQLNTALGAIANFNGHMGNRLYPADGALLTDQNSPYTEYSKSDDPIQETLDELRRRIVEASSSVTEADRLGRRSNYRNILRLMNKADELTARKWNAYDSMRRFEQPTTGSADVAETKAGQIPRRTSGQSSEQQPDRSPEHPRQSSRISDWLDSTVIEGAEFRPVDSDETPSWLKSLGPTPLSEPEDFGPLSPEDSLANPAISKPQLPNKPTTKSDPLADGDLPLIWPVRFRPESPVTPIPEPLAQPLPLKPESQAAPVPKTETPIETPKDDTNVRQRAAAEFKRRVDTAVERLSRSLIDYELMELPVEDLALLSELVEVRINNTDLNTPDLLEKDRTKKTLETEAALHISDALCVFNTYDSVKDWEGLEEVDRLNFRNRVDAVRRRLGLRMFEDLDPNSRIAQLVTEYRGNMQAVLDMIDNK